MGKEYKKELMEKYGINPDLTSRDWSEPEREILAMGIEQIRDDVKDVKQNLGKKVENVKERVKENREDINENAKWINNRQKLISNEEREEEIETERTKARWERRGVILAAIIASIGWLLTAIGVI